VWPAQEEFQSFLSRISASNVRVDMVNDVGLGWAMGARGGGGSVVVGEKTFRFDLGLAGRRLFKMSCLF
jgi:hypothetical protein